MEELGRNLRAQVEEDLDFDAESDLKEHGVEYLPDNYDIHRGSGGGATLKLDNAGNVVGGGMSVEARLRKMEVANKVLADRFKKLEGVVVSRMRLLEPLLGRISEMQKKRGVF